MKQKTKKNKIGGVTLVEIMIVIAVIGIVAVFAIPNYLRSRQTASTASLEETARQIAQKMEMIFWGQNPNEYPPQSAMPNSLTTWAAPTNLGNIQDLLDLLKKLCEQQGKSMSEEELAGSILDSADTLQSVIDFCFTRQPSLIYTSPNGGQTYSFSIESPTGTAYTVSPGGVRQVPAECSGDIGCDDGLFCNGTETCQGGSCQSGVNPCGAGNTCNESDQSCAEGICGNDIWEGMEDCGEEGYTDCSYEFMECQSCRCEFVGCPDGYSFKNWECVPTPQGCPPGSLFQFGIGCCRDHENTPWPLPIDLPPCGEVDIMDPSGVGEAPSGGA